MQIIKHTREFLLKESTAVAIGKFDGIHIGHKTLLTEILKQKKKGLKATVFTFDPPANVFFAKEDTLESEILTKTEKRAYFQQMGIDYLVEFPLTEETAKITANEFVTEILQKQMNMKYIVAGEDVSFGYKGAGNANLLYEFANDDSYKVCILPKVMCGNHVISSSLIREKLSVGDMELVHEMLGRPYEITGQVLEGAQLGRTIQMPTANIKPPCEKCVLPSGVYYTNVYVNHKKFHAVTNIGYKPTVSKERELGIESFLFDFDQFIYGESITVQFLHYKRPEKQFESFVQLAEQIRQDKESACNYFQEI